ncbi:protein FLC EXPRESSOR-like [Papaver somniferum]|uniref:protein FLC EXPRESSOR-like n=1 Tax=Papaver somniferum TaxID=3469 RepID=UPI000E6FE77F|nr:protein FLC EXPRESSOR-like [Papaver somniferum]
MEGRNRIHLREMQLGGGGRSSQIPLHPIENHHHHHHLQQPDFHPHQALIEEQLHHQHREMQNLLLDNQRLAATHVALKQEVSASNEEIRHISTVASQVKADRDIEIRELHQHSLKLESEVLTIGKFSAELAQAKVDIHKLNANKLELTSKLQTVNGDLVRVRQEREEAKSIESDIDAMRIEVQKGRAAIEFEKKAHAENLEHKQVLEKNMNELTRAIEKLRSELADAEKRAQAANTASASVMVAPNPGPVYAGSYGHPQMGYVGVGHSYVNPYNMHHMVEPNFDARFQYGSEAIAYAPYGVQQSQVYR